MLNRKNVINNMCFTWKHDYGLLDEKERKALFIQMAQIYDNDIAANLPKYKIGDKVVIMYAQRTIKECECCETEIEDHGEKEEVIAKISTITIDEYSIRYGLRNVIKNYPDTKMVFAESEIKRIHNG